MTPKKITKIINKKNGPLKQKIHQILDRRTFTQRAADKLTAIMGSWTFIFIFIAFMIAWIFINTIYLIKYTSSEPWDPYPFILLNLALSSLAAIQAPIILMSQNRQSEKDRSRADYDYAVNRKAEREIQEIRKQLNRIEDAIEKKKR